MAGYSVNTSGHCTDSLAPPPCFNDSAPRTLVFQNTEMAVHNNNRMFSSNYDTKSEMTVIRVLPRFLSIGKKAYTERLKWKCQIQVLRNTPTHTTAQLD